jgi:hypothetical protein
MALSPQSIQEMDSYIERISRQIWNLPITFRKVGLHARLEDMGLNIDIGGLLWSGDPLMGTDLQ